MKVIEAALEESHDCSVERRERDRVFRPGGIEVHRLAGLGDNSPERLFTIRDGAKITNPRSRVNGVWKQTGPSANFSKTVRWVRADGSGDDRLRRSLDRHAPHRGRRTTRFIGQKPKYAGSRSMPPS
jgi:hypothetical protein